MTTWLRDDYLDLMREDGLSRDARFLDLFCLRLIDGADTTVSADWITYLSDLLDFDAQTAVDELVAAGYFTPVPDGYQRFSTLGITPKAAGALNVRCLR